MGLTCHWAEPLEPLQSLELCGLNATLLADRHLPEMTRTAPGTLPASPRSLWKPRPPHTTRSPQSVTPCVPIKFFSDRKKKKKISGWNKPSSEIPSHTVLGLNLFLKKEVLIRVTFCPLWFLVMKIMSYEIPIYCWQLKRPGTEAAHNFRVPLYLVTNLFRGAGGCRLGLGGSPCPSAPQGRCGGLLGARTRGPGIWMSPLRRAQRLALRRFQIASKMSAQQRHLSKNKGRAFFLSLSPPLYNEKASQGDI